MNKLRRILCTVCVSLIVIGFDISISLAQITSGGLTGTVFDPSGAIVPKAAITVTNTSTHVVRTFITDASGYFSFPALPVGAYDLKAEFPGFGTQEITGIVVNVTSTRNADVHFSKVGGVSQVVTVQASALKVQTETSSLGQLVTEQQMVALPLNGRVFLQLATLGSGTVPAYESRSSPIGPNTDRADLAVHISGGRGDANSFLIDGVDTRGYFLGQPSILLSVDAIQEFLVQKNAFEARYGQGSGLVNVITRSGSNSLHGVAYEYLRNDVLDANNYFNNYFGEPKAPYKQNQFGISVGGPVLKSRLVFFANYEGFRVLQGNTLTALVPTPSQLSGNLDGLTSSLKDPATGQPAILNPYTGQPFPGNQIPPSMLSQIVQKFKQYIPAPNATVPGINLLVSPNTTRSDDQGTGRLDWTINDHDTMFVRYIKYDSSLIQPGIAPLYGTDLPIQGQNAAVEETHIFTPTLLNVAKLAYNRSEFFTTNMTGPSNFASEFGIKNLDNSAREDGLPSFNPTGFSEMGGSNILQGSLENIYTADDEIDWTRGRHTMSFGTDLRYQQMQVLIGLDNDGAFGFDGIYTGNSVADMLLGAASSAVGEQGLALGNFRSLSQNYFVQDNIKATRRLTLNLGLRYEYNQPPYEINGREGFFDTTQDRIVVRIPESASPIILPPSEVDYDPSYRKGIWKPDRRDWAPRVGFAYGLSKNSVVRGGYGIFYSKAQGQEIQGKLSFPPLEITNSLTGSATSPPSLLIDQVAFPPASEAAYTGALSPFSVDPNDRTPYLQQWNLNIQHTFGGNTLLEIAYAGSKGTHLGERININQASLPNLQDITPIADRRPYQGWADILDFTFQGWSNYNGLQTRLEKSYSNGLTFLIGYTWSHSLDSTSQGTGSTEIQDVSDRAANYGSSDFDVRNNFIFNYTYELPFGRGKRFLSSNGDVIRKLVSGWSVNGITTFMTGNYYSVLMENDQANTGTYAAQRGNEVPGCKNNGNLPRGQRTPSEYFNTACFTPSAYGTYGTSGRNIVEVPGINNWDASIIKNTQITERVALQFRSEFFNVWNHAQFGVPDNYPQTPTFGEITSAFAPREIQFGTRLSW